MCGADGWEDMEEYGKAQAAWFTQRLDLPHGLPSHDPFRRVVARVDPEALTQCLLSWTGALRELSGGDIVSIDGKTVRHAFARATSTAAMHLGSAWASAHRRVLGQGKGEDKSNEITAIPPRVQLLDLAGATVTLAARGCQTESAQVIPEPGADDVLALKKNHATLSDKVTRFLGDAQTTAFADIPQAYHETVEGDHGRMETRRYWITSEIEW
jgi:predicted transposase YbfD/YdcC